MHERPGHQATLAPIMNKPAVPKTFSKRDIGIVPEKGIRILTHEVRLTAAIQSDAKLKSSHGTLLSSRSVLMMHTEK